MKKVHQELTLRLRSERIRHAVRLPRFRCENDGVLYDQVGCTRGRASEPERQTVAEKEARIRRLPGRFPGAQPYCFRNRSMLRTSGLGPNSDTGDRPQESSADDKDSFNR